MISLDKAMTSPYKLSIVTMTIRSDLAANLNAKFLPAAVIHVRRIIYMPTCVMSTYQCMEIDEVGH